MEWSCKDLPAEDVEACIRHFRAVVPKLDPSKPADREKIAHEIAKFFADPGRKYKRAIQESEEATLAAMQESEREKAGLQQTISAQEEQIRQFQKDADIRAAADHERKTRNSARRKLVWVILAFVTVEGLILYAADKLGTGSTLAERVWSSWDWLSLGFVAAVAAAWLVLGRNGIAALGWPLTKLFGGD